MFRARFCAALMALGAAVAGLSLGADDDAMAPYKQQMRGLAQETQKGSFYDVQVPGKLDDFRAAMLAVGNLGRRDDKYRTKHGEKLATDLSGATVLFPKEIIKAAEDQTHKIMKNSQTPPYFKDIVLNDALNKAAQFQAEYIASKDTGNPEHIGPDTFDGDNMKYSWDRTKHFGYEGSGGEIGGAGSDPDSYPEGWMQSDTHFMGWFNIGVDLREMGLGAARGKSGNWYFFGVGGRDAAPPASNARQSARVQPPVLPGHATGKSKPVAVIKAVDLTNHSLVLAKSGSTEQKYTLARNAKVTLADGKPGKLAAGMSVLKYSLGPKDKTMVMEITVQQGGTVPKTDPKKTPAQTPKTDPKKVPTQAPKTDPKKDPAPAPANAADYAKHMKAGNAAVQQKHYGIAMREFKAALSAKPGDQAATAALQNAKTHLAQATADYNNHMKNGKAAMQAKNYAAAVKEFEAALTIHAGDQEATALLKQARGLLKK